MRLAGYWSCNVYLHITSVRSACEQRVGQRLIALCCLCCFFSTPSTKTPFLQALYSIWCKPSYRRPSGKGVRLKSGRSRVRIPLAPGFFRGRHTSDLQISTPVATLPSAWRYRVSAGTGWPGVSIPSLGEMESWICNYYLSVAARKIEQTRP